jgi:hypothetical protein
MSNNKTQSQSAGPLTFEIANSVAGALSRLEELAAYSVKLPAHDAEIRGTHEFLANTFINHGAEFLGCWFTVRREYEPALKAIAQVAFRVRAILAPPQVPAKDVEEDTTPANIVQLNAKQPVNIDS